MQAQKGNGMIQKTRKKRILIADDDKAFRKFTESVLESAGYTVEAVETAGSAFKEMRRRPYDLLVLDSRLPGKMAIKLSQALKKSSRSSRIPIMFILGSKTVGELEYEEQRIVEDGYAHLRKPFTAKELVVNVRSLLGKSPDNGESQSSEETISSRRMFWMPWRRQTAASKNSVASERRLSK